MLRPKKMKKARVIVIKSVVEKLVKDLHEAGVVEITKTKHEGLEEGRPLSSFEEISGHLVKLRGLVAVMEANVSRKTRGELRIMEANRAIEETKKLDIEEKLKSLANEAASLFEQIKELESKITVVKKITHFGTVDFSRLNTKNLHHTLGEISNAKLQTLKDKLEKIGENSVVSKPGVSVVLILYDAKKETGIETLLADIGFNQIELPDGTTTPNETLNLLDQDLDAKNTRLKAVKNALASLSETNLEKVKTIIRSLEVEAERAEVTARFTSSKYLYVVEGWILEENFDKLRLIVHKYGHDTALEEAQISHEEVPPTVLENLGVASPFEFITKNYSFPGYYEIDPTFTYFIGLSVLYGIIVGDVLYGLLSMIISYALLKKFSKNNLMKSVAMIWLISGVPTMFFGVLFDEWGGMTHIQLVEYITSWTGITLIQEPIYTGFHRVENLGMLLLATLFVGTIHLAVGFMLGMINEWDHSKKHAIAKLGWLCFEFGIIMIFLSQLGFREVDREFTVAGAIVAVISVIIIVVTEGAAGMVEIPGFIGNVLSYVRIAVIGVVGVILAEILNEFLRPMPSQGVFALVLLPIFLLLHAANCIIAMFEALVQGGRLNIFEFRSKFIRGGGRVFHPFALHSKNMK